MYHLFELFLAKMRDSFKRIVKAARHEVTEGDLQSDAWILAADIGKRRRRPIDFSNPADQDLVIRAVNVKNVRRGDWKLRRSVRIDSEPEHDDGAPKWSERLAAGASSDPLVSLLLHESARDEQAMLANSYSQAAAYVVVFVRFKNDRKEVCAFLVVSNRVLARRVTHAADTVRVQPSLFDGIEKISDSFMPLAGRVYSVAVRQERFGEQHVWVF
jgi:hypothetical protein